VCGKFCGPIPEQDVHFSSLLCCFVVSCERVSTHYEALFARSGAIGIKMQCLQQLCDVRARRCVTAVAQPVERIESASLQEPNWNRFLYRIYDLRKESTATSFRDTFV